MSLTFKLPPLDELRKASFDLSPRQTEMYDYIYDKVIHADFISSIDPDVAPELVQLVIRYLLNVTMPRRELILFHYVDPETSHEFIRASMNPYTFHELVLCFFLCNLPVFGIFTELWEPMPTYMFLSIGDTSDVYLHRGTEDLYSDYADGQLDRLYDEQRDKVIESTYAEDKNNTVIIQSDATVPLTDDIKDCRICCEEDTAEYVCSKCNYPICPSCLEHIRKSTGLCPCCRNAPLELIAINKVLHLKNESTERIE